MGFRLIFINYMLSLTVSDHLPVVEGFPPIKVYFIYESPFEVVFVFLLLSLKPTPTLLSPFFTVISTETVSSFIKLVKSDVDVILKTCDPPNVAMEI